MAELIVGATFVNFAAFEEAMNKYCVDNSQNGVPLKFTRQTSKLLKLNPDKPTLDAATVANCKYLTCTYICKFHKSNDPKGKWSIHCEGRILLSFDQRMKVLVVKNVVEHKCHEIHPSDQKANVTGLVQQRANQLQLIQRLLARMPDEALTPIQTACEHILDNWDDANHGLMLSIAFMDETEGDCQPSSANHSYEDQAIPIIKSEPLDENECVSTKPWEAKMSFTRSNDTFLKPEEDLNNNDSSHVVSPKSDLDKSPKKGHKRKPDNNNNNESKSKLRYSGFKHLSDENAFEDDPERSFELKVKKEH